MSILWVLDKSAHVRLSSGATLPSAVDPARLAVCDMGILEWLYSAQSADGYDAQARSLAESFAILDAPADIFARVRRLQSNLAHHHGMWHRTAIPDLFIAETALHHEAGVLHHDGHYRRIGEVRPGLVHRGLEEGT